MLLIAQADITLSREALAAATLVVGTLWSALVLMWRDQRRADRARIADLARQRDELLRVLFRLNLTDEIPDDIPHDVIPPPPRHGPRRRGDPPTEEE